MGRSLPLLDPCVGASRPTAGAKPGQTGQELNFLSRDSGSEEWQGEEEQQRAHKGQRELLLPNRQIDPFSVRFSQMRARSEFRDGSALEDAISEIKAIRCPTHEGQETVWQLEAPFPPIEVLPYQCKLRDEQGRPMLDEKSGGEIWDSDTHIFTLDNRRLVCYQKAAAALWPDRAVISVFELPPQSLTRMREVRKFRTLDSGQTICVGARNDEDSLVRWSWREAVGLAAGESANAEVGGGCVKMRRRPRGEPRNSGRRPRRDSDGDRRGDFEGPGGGAGHGPVRNALIVLVLYLLLRACKELVVAGASAAAGVVGGDVEPLLGKELLVAGASAAAGAGDGDVEPLLGKASSLAAPGALSAAANETGASTFASGAIILAKRLPCDPEELSESATGFADELSLPSAGALGEGLGLLKQAPPRRSP